MTKNHKTNITIAIVLVLLILVGVTWLILWQRSSNDTNQGQPQINEPSLEESGVEPNEPATYITLEDWGIRFEAPAETEALSYKVVRDGAESYEFTTRNVEALGERCANAEDAIRLFSLARSIESELPYNSIAANNGNPIDGYYYYIGGGQSYCAETGTDVQETERQIILEMLKSPTSN